MNITAAFTGFSVDNSDVAKDFYTRIIGLDLASDTMGLHFRLPFGGIVFVYEKPDHRPADYTVLNFVVSDIDAAVDELVHKGVGFERYPNLFSGAEQDAKGIMRSPDTAKYGPSIAWFKDPAGNTLAVIQDDKR